MSRTILDLNLGTEVWLHETVSGVETTVPYILIRKDSQGGVLLRKNCSKKKRMNPTNTTVYDGCEADVYLNDTETGFLSRFPVGERTCFQSRSISTFEYGDTEAHSISRRCYLLSYGDLFNAQPSDLEPEVGTVYSLLTHNETFDFYNARIRNLEKGSRGGYPSILQALLICAGYTCCGFDGIFGAGTEAAVREFQYRSALYVDGIAGKETFEALATR